MKLTLRDLFWLVLVVATGCAWWIERREHLADARRASKWETQATDLRQYIEDDGGVVEAYDRCDHVHVRWTSK